MSIRQGMDMSKLRKALRALEVRVAELEKLLAKRGPGRPPKLPDKVNDGGTD